jgi:AcrR family transcriptional regulator
VLRQVAHALVPFIQAKLRENLGHWLHVRTVSGVARIPLPFDPNVRPTPPQKNLKFLERYFLRARRAGRLRVRDPLAAAFAFAATLQSFVILQEVIPILEKPMPLDTYLETVIEIWRRGAITGPGSRR